MWFFRKRPTLEASGYFRGFVDWHSHILPGVDDGVQTPDEALQILAAYERLGVKEVWCTPHIMEDIPNATARLRACFSALKAAYAGPVELNLAAENMLDNLFEERLEQDDLLPLGKDGKGLLVETSYFNPPMDMYELLERIKQKGYNIILAHPERYLYMSESDYRKLQTMHIDFQLNLPSLFGMYGKSVQKRAEWLLSKKMYTYKGTDLHRITVLSHLCVSELHNNEITYIEN